MQRIDCDARYFNPADVLECGQTFRYSPYREGYLVFSRDRVCYLHSNGVKTVIECEDENYFYNYFDLDRDYEDINKVIKSFNVPVLTLAAERCAGLRLLNQDAEEMIFSFIVSQNNNIPRIKAIIERLCAALGESVNFNGESYRAFPSASALSRKDAAFYKGLGAGYRDVFLADTSKRIAAEGVDGLRSLPSAELKGALLSYRGVGPKVADCISLFGFGRGDCFPVDTWIEKLYRENFGGTLKNREKISQYFISLFGDCSGLAQQYLFYAKREGLLD